MRFSEHFAITKTGKDDWFDPHLTVDTKLFVDPLLVLRKGTDNRWKCAHDQLIAHFVYAYELVAKATSDRSVEAQHARRLLRFPEPGEFCLGYTARGTRGSGSGSAMANQMANGIAIAIAAGLRNPEHIEELGILNEGIGADRISDAVCNVLKGRFIRYTQAIAERHGIPVEPHNVQNAACYLEDGRWAPEEALLPTNPTNGKAILLVPRRFLNDLPVLNADDWFDSGLNADVRAMMNKTIGSKARKADIVDWAKKHPDRVRDWARSVASRAQLDGYDFTDDPRGLVQWDAAGGQFASQNPIQSLAAVETQDDLRALLVEMLRNFKHFIEDQRGWALLWDSRGKEKPEEAAQLLFLGMAQHYFRMFGIELDREVELGRGPVDFKLSKGTPIRLILEMKKAHNGTFWNGLEQQLPSYLRSDDVHEGWYIALQYRSTKDSEKKLARLPSRVKAVSGAVGKDLRCISIDARPKKSASKIKAGGS